MATYLPTNITNSTSFIQQLDEVRISIQQVFRDLMEKLQLREATLLKQLEDIKSDYELSQEKQEALNALKSQRDFAAQNLKLNQFKELQQQQVEQLNQMTSNLEMEDGEERSISWSWDSQLIEAISAVGKLEVRKPVSVDYKQKVKPIISKCTTGSNDGDLKATWDVAVHMNTGNIYITDNGNHCVKVYTSNGDFLFKFGDHEKLFAPHNICIHKEKLYLSHNHGVVIFSVSGKLLHRFDAEGSNDDQFMVPCGIAISPLNYDIYICDSNNHRVQIYDSAEIRYKSTKKIKEIGKGSLSYPVDIKFAQNELYILDDRDPCLHVYTTEHVYVRSFISQGPDKLFSFSLCFHIDNNCNILITDYGRHYLCIFTNGGELLHQIGGGESSDMYKPKGVTTDRDGIIIIVNEKSTAKLLIY